MDRETRYQGVVPHKHREDLLYLYHDSLLGSHFGRDKQYGRMVPLFYWPGMYKSVEEHVRNCRICELSAGTEQARGNAMTPIIPYCCGELRFLLPMFSKQQLLQGGALISPKWSHLWDAVSTPQGDSSKESNSCILPLVARKPTKPFSQLYDPIMEVLDKFIKTDGYMSLSQRSTRSQSIAFNPGRKSPAP